MTAQHLRIRPARRAGRWTINVAILLVLLFALAWLAPSLFGFSRYVITGGSMTGTINKGSVVFEKPTEVKDLKVGDVITYLPPPSSGVPTLVTHRIVKMEPAEGGGTLFTTKGDANQGVDPWRFKLVDEKQPVVQFHVPHAGWVFIALADRNIRMLVIGAPAALIALGALGQLLTALRGSRIREESGTEEALVPARRIFIPSQRTAPVADAPDEKPFAAPELV